jgi:AmmeMemoRadiSam system protein A
VSAGEVDGLRIEVSVLSEAQRLSFSSPEDLLLKLQPGVDGVILRIGNRMATYLPQVWEQLPDKERFLDSLAEKAGCEPSDWRKPGTNVYLYEVESFKEPGA